MSTLTPRTVIRLGKQRTQHSWRCHIEDGQVVVRTGCGIEVSDDRTLVLGYVGCKDCYEREGKH